MKTSRPKRPTGRLLGALLLALAATIVLLSVEERSKPIAGEGLYFQDWSSEKMMQTVSIADLRDEPVRSLWYLHIQPPAFDLLRAALAQVAPSGSPTETLRRVDSQIYVLWALLYGATVFLLFWWLCDLTSTLFSAAATLLFAVHPAVIFYATFLETTLLTAFLVLCLCYLLWRIKEERAVSIGLLAATFLALYFTRSLFQWHWLLLLPVCLLLLGWPRKKVLLLVGIVALAVGLFTIKQMALFDLSSTTSFTGYNLCNSSGLDDGWKQYGASRAPQQDGPADLPYVLSRAKKVTGAVNYNNAHYLEVNRELQQEYRRHLRTAPAGQLLRAAYVNLGIYLKPSSRYTPNVIVDRLPWRSAYDLAMSSPVLPLMLILACLFWLWNSPRSGYFRALGLFLPVAAIALLCVLFERGENMRFKFFLEPALFLFVATQAYWAGKKLMQRPLSEVSRRRGT